MKLYIRVVRTFDRRSATSSSSRSRDDVAMTRGHTWLREFRGVAESHGFVAESVKTFAVISKLAQTEPKWSQLESSGSWTGSTNLPPVDSDAACRARKRSSRNWARSYFQAGARSTDARCSLERPSTREEERERAGWKTEFPSTKFILKRRIIECGYQICGLWNYIYVEFPTKISIVFFKHILELILP